MAKAKKKKAKPAARRRPAVAAKKKVKAAAAGAGAPATVPPELQPVVDDFLKAIDGGEASHWDLGDAANKYSPRVESSPYGRLSVFYSKVIMPLRKHAPSYSSLTLYARVANVWGRDLAFLGVAKLGVTIAYLNTAGIPIPTDPRTLKIAVPSDHGTVECSFEECTVEDIRDALRALSQGTAAPLPADARATTDLIAKALESVEDHGAAHVAPKMRGAEPTLDLVALPLNHIRDLVGAMYFAFFPLPT